MREMYVIKRNGEYKPFEMYKVRAAIEKGFASVSQPLDEELIEDALLCLCTPEKCFVWKGFEAEASEKQEKKFLAAVTADYYGESRSDFAFEEPGDESYEFLNYF